jgi:hypothetical protein
MMTSKSKLLAGVLLLVSLIATDIMTRGMSNPRLKAEANTAGNQLASEEVNPVSVASLADTQGQGGAIGSCADSFPGVKITHLIVKRSGAPVDVFEVDWEFNPQQTCPKPDAFLVTVEVTRKDGIRANPVTPAKVSAFARSATVEVAHGASPNVSAKATVTGTAQVSWKDQKSQNY